MKSIFLTLLILPFFAHACFADEQFLINRIDLFKSESLLELSDTDGEMEWFYFGKIAAYEEVKTEVELLKKVHDWQSWH
jgi:hypothetical protein